MGQCVGKPVDYKTSNSSLKNSKKEKKLRRKQKNKSQLNHQANSVQSVNQATNSVAPISPPNFYRRSPPSAGHEYNYQAGVRPEDVHPQACVTDKPLPSSHSTEDINHNAHTAVEYSNVPGSEDSNPSNDVQTSYISPPERRAPTSPLRRMFASPKSIGGPRVLFKSPLGPGAKQLAFRREKNNSTSTLFVKDSISSPDVDEIIRCMAVALLYHIKNGMRSDVVLDTVFNEQIHPLTRESLDLTSLPDINTIYRFINMIFRVQRLPPECAILCIAYLEKVLMGGRIVLHSTNWRRLVFSSIMLATKVWEDESVWNVDFLDVFPLLTILDLNKMENRFLEFLQFNVITTGSEYAKYYFELRALSQGERFTLEPLNRESQAKLEERSQKTNTKVAINVATRGVTPKRCRSVDNYNPKSPPVTIH